MLMKRLRTSSDDRVIGHLGHHGGSIETRVLNFAEQGFWFGGGVLADKNRYWNCFGLGAMKSGESRNIMCEINPPVSGVTGSVGGAFIVNANGKVALASRGKLGGGKRGVGKASFEKLYGGSWVNVSHDGKKHKLVLVDYLNSRELLEHLGDYINAVAKIKGKITGSVDSDALTTAALLATAAASGNTTGLSRGQKEGLKKLKKSWVYERSAKNRRIALARWGNACSVCEVSFDECYGQKLARGFIEFHHLHPVSLGPRMTDPAKDLRPLCSNCHSMAHRRQPVPVPIGELRRLLSR